MVAVFLGLGLALLAAVAVLVVASVTMRRETPGADAAGGLRGFWDAFRGGVRPRPRDERGDRAAERPVDTDMDSFFAATSEAAPPYVDAAELSDVLHLTRERAVQTLHAPRALQHRGARRSGPARPAHPPVAGPVPGTVREG